MSIATKSTAREILDDLSTLDRDARRSAQGFWFPLILFGALTMASAPFAGSSGMGIFWAIAGPGGAVVTGVWYHRQRTAVVLPGWPYGLVSLGIIGGCFLVADLATDDWRSAVPFFVVAAGYALFAGIERSIATLGFAVAAAVVAMAFVAADASDSLWLPLTIGALGVAVGAGALFRRRAGQ